MFKNVEAKTIKLKLADLEDAEFIFLIRTNDKYNKFLSKNEGKIKEQQKWLEYYKERERLGVEYYFIILRKDTNKKIGTVRLYDFIDRKSSFCWGSWILNEDKTNSSALESALLVYKLAFEELGYLNAHFDVRRKNEKVIAFHKKMGAQIVNENDFDVFFTYSKNEFNNRLAYYDKFLRYN